MILALRVDRGVLVLAARRRVTLARMSTTTKRKASKDKNPCCGADAQADATFCWHCSAPIGDAAKKTKGEAKAKKAKKSSK